MGANGIIPITQAPPADVSPTTSGYGTTFGALELLNSTNATIPTDLASSYTVKYQFEEYYLTVNEDNEVVKISINGQTIDWANSGLSQSGSLSVDLGVERPYALVGKSYTAHKYTFLELTAVLNESGVEKPVSWVVRMKHFDS